MWLGLDLSVWPRHWDSGAGDFAWCYVDGEFTSHRMGWYGCFPCSIAELILSVQCGDWRGTFFLVVGLLCRAGLLCWAVMCFWFGLESLKIYDSVQLGVSLWLTLLQLFCRLPTQISKNIGCSKLTLMSVVEFCK